MNEIAFGAIIWGGVVSAVSGAVAIGGSLLARDEAAARGIVLPKRRRPRVATLVSAAALAMALMAAAAGHAYAAERVTLELDFVDFLPDDPSHPPSAEAGGLSSVPHGEALAHVLAPDGTVSLSARIATVAGADLEVPVRVGHVMRMGNLVLCVDGQDVMPSCDNPTDDVDAILVGRPQSNGTVALSYSMTTRSAGDDKRSAPVAGEAKLRPGQSLVVPYRIAVDGTQSLAVLSASASD